jgi:allene oxide cyclase-like protein
MRKLAVTTATVLALVGATAPAAWAHDDGGTLEVIAKFTKFDAKDVGDKGPSEGDFVLFGYKLFTKTGDHGFDPAGHGGGGCKLTDVDLEDHEIDSMCKAVFALDGGKIVTAGEVSHADLEDGRITLGIAGGTGDYADAEGEAVIEFIDHGDHPHDGAHAHSVAHKGQGMDGNMHHGGKDGHGMGLAKVTFIFDE